MLQGILIALQIVFAILIFSLLCLIEDMIANNKKEMEKNNDKSPKEH